LICAGVALLTSIITLSILKKGGKNDIPIDTERPEVEETLCPELQPTYHYGKISYYDRTYCEKHNPGCRTASGEVFDDTALTCACGYDYQLGTVFKVSYKENSVVVRCNDRGGFESKGRTLDLSEKAFEAIAPKSKGVIEAKIEVVYSEYDQFNQYRESQGLPKLARNSDLEESANESAKDIYDEKRGWNHDGYQEYITNHYGDWQSVGENLARSDRTFDGILSLWHISEKHKDIMQDKDFCEIGIGHYKYIWVLHLGRKK